MTAAHASPLLVVLSGPSGVGKDSVLGRLKELGHPYHFIITATTRAPRPAERDGVDYFFLSEHAFGKLRQRGELLEWARVYNHEYGVPKDQVRKAITEGKTILVRTDIQGASSIKSLVPEAVLIFLKPSSIEELERRVRQRGPIKPADLKLRLLTARQEMKRAADFDYVVVNRKDQLDRTVAAVEAIITAESHRPRPRGVRL
ncbi:MAG: guanylate kinase [Dehalococcoidia bacterium]|nr:guanylate kinase [Dehalococcoidia bacterium]